MPSRSQVCGHLGFVFPELLPLNEGVGKLGWVRDFSDPFVSAKVCIQSEFQDPRGFNSLRGPGASGYD